MDFTPYDIALRAKAKGFNEPCTGKIDHRGVITHCESGQTITNQFLYYSAAACTNEQLAGWFKTKHDKIVPPTNVELSIALDQL
jgi:hypothetical protein